MSELVLQQVTEALSRARSFNWDDVLLRYAEKHAYPPDVVDLHARELIRFLTLAGLSHEPLPMQGPVDELWHEFVLHSELYSEFCKTVVGRFVHHEPSGPPAGDQAEAEAQQRWNAFSKLYFDAFGEQPPVQVWPQTDTVETGSREWWKRRLEKLADGNETAWWWREEDNATIRYCNTHTSTITYCNTHDTTSTASDTCTAGTTRGSS